MMDGFHYKFTYPRDSARNSNINKTAQELINPFSAFYHPKGSTASIFNLHTLRGWMTHITNPTLGYFIKVFPKVVDGYMTYDLKYRVLNFRHISKGILGYEEFNLSQYVDIVGMDGLSHNSLDTRRFELLEQSHVDFNRSPYVQGSIEGAYFDDQPNVTYQNGKLVVENFDNCFLSRDQYVYLMNNIMSVHSRNGYLLISGARIETNDIATLSRRDKKFNSGEGYFTLKFEAVVEDENGEINLDQRERSVRGTPAPIITLANPCPPIWNPTISDRKLIQRVGEVELLKMLGIFYRHCILGDDSASGTSD